MRHLKKRLETRSKVNARKGGAQSCFILPQDLRVRPGGYQDRPGTLDFVFARPPLGYPWFQVCLPKDLPNNPGLIGCLEGTSYDAAKVVLPQTDDFKGSQGRKRAADSLSVLGAQPQPVSMAASDVPEEHCNRNACPRVTRVIKRATLYRNFQEKCRGPDWAQNADIHFVQACAVEMHVHMSQASSEEPL